MKIYMVSLFHRATITKSLYDWVKERTDKLISMSSVTHCDQYNSNISVHSL